MFVPLQISPATSADLPALADLVNNAYRGEASLRGWTTEAHLLDGPRTNEADLRELSAAPGATFLLARTDSGELVGSVYIKPQAPDLYVGMLSVDPTRQAAGIGRQLLAATEVQARQAGHSGVLISVISVRYELIAWYERLGFQRTGEVLPFPLDASPSIPKQPLELLLLRKAL
ncbi:GNAT family N-acetyltransferase [Hymenobacter puniceus]|uniref:GNAT family N-acetyltransferase n=1 Tax=Hymenobacter sp. BT190 TaxID=2763505 RepID=UPI0016517433|nr:GNAT family N-acetyltransferase [Hymenobacter sp. BT190]MBC6699361.1 GNAT family N-acetyltransferase [Hymenobacter sp. BT190]